MMDSIRGALDVHLDWVVLHVNIANAFNIIFHKVIFQELCAISKHLFQLIPFFVSFYAQQLLQTLNNNVEFKFEN
jgi:hypothetical protein